MGKNGKRGNTFDFFRTFFFLFVPKTLLDFYLLLGNKKYGQFVLFGFHLKENNCKYLNQTEEKGQEENEQEEKEHVLRGFNQLERK